MLQASSWERPAAGAGRSMWVPGMSMTMYDAGSLSARAQEIARRREEMMGMLHDLPESEYELSLTDLVEKVGAKEDPAGSSSSGRLAAGQQVQQPTGRPAPDNRRGSSSARRRDGSSLRSSSDGVLLNFYMPRSLTRSFTAPRPSRTPSIPGGRTLQTAASVASDCSKSRRTRERDADADTVKCWSLPWDRPWRKSSRRDPAAPPKDNIRAAILIS